METNKESLLGVIDYFIKNPFAEKYQKVSRRSWALFIQANFPDSTGEWLDINDFHFFNKIRPSIEGAAENQIQANMPANLPALVREMEKEKALRAEWEIKRHRHLIEKDIQPQIDLLQQRIAQNPMEKKGLVQDLDFLNSLKDFTKRRENYLRARNSGADFSEDQSFEEVIPEAYNQTAAFVNRVFDETRLAKRLGLSEEQLNGLSEDTISFIIQRTFNAQNPKFFGQPEKQLTQSIQKVLADAFDYYVRRPAYPTNWAAVRNAIPALRTEKARAAHQIAAEIKASYVPAAPAPMISAIKTAMLANYAVSEESIEAGNPLGRLPSYIIWNLAKSFSKKQILDLPPEYFIRAFESPEKKLSQSQRAAMTKYVEFLKSFARKNPKAFSAFHWHQKHLIGIGWGKAVTSWFLNSPDYILHFPFIAFKYWARNKWSLQWQYKFKPRVFGAIINNVPFFGNVLGFLYKKDEWGFYENPWQRFKSKVLERALQKTFRGAASLLYKIGNRFKQAKLGKVLLAWAEKLGVIASTGGLGALFFAFYPQFKRTLKAIAGFFTLGAVAIFSWLAQYGLPALIGGGVGAVVGPFAGGYTAWLVFQATLPFLGPFALIPAALTFFATWLVSIGVFGGLGVLIAKIGEWLGLSGGPAAAAAAEELGGALTAIDLTPAAKIIIPSLGGIAGLAMTTIMITSSAYIIPSEGEIYGSKYIQVQKGFDINGQAQNRLEFTNDEIVGQTINYGIEVNIIDKVLTDIKINDKLEIIKNDVVLYQQENWSAGSLDTWTTTYSVKADDRFKDAYVSNTVTVTTAEGESQILNLTLTVGQPPAPASAALARKIINALLGCQDLDRLLNGVVINKDNWPTAENCLRTNGVPQTAIDQLARFQNNFYNLQCVHFVVAATNGDLEYKGSAKDYCSKPAGAYKRRVDWEGVKEGDILASDYQGPGHVALVLRRFDNSQGELLYLEVAEAIGDNGVVQTRMPVKKETLVSRYCGYLRK